ncbi:MAG: hypothetical protein A2066_04270 [Bacteroidetes bacterium GWB2_41_8]|nr:MAG: hypothetical protein A2066_04270 [Bacteroidetes bacterium GWB2_41_8]
MRKFAANYVISNTGKFLKNGIVVAGEDGSAAQFIDTKGDLREIAQLTFHNGILMTGTLFVKTTTAAHNSDQPFESLIIKSVAELTQFSNPEIIDLAKKVQHQFPEIKIPEIMTRITTILQTNAGFSMEITPGIYLLSGADLVNLHFTPKSKLKKIL